MSHNELGYTTLSVAEPRRGVSVGAPSCRARSVTEDNVPLGRARALVPSGACQPLLCGVARNPKSEVSYHEGLNSANLKTRQSKSRMETLNLSNQPKNLFYLIRSVPELKRNSLLK